MLQIHITSNKGGIVMSRIIPLSEIARTKFVPISAHITYAGSLYVPKVCGHGVDVVIDDYEDHMVLHVYANPDKPYKKYQYVGIAMFRWYFSVHDVKNFPIFYEWQDEPGYWVINIDKKMADL